MANIGSDFVDLIHGKTSVKIRVWCRAEGGFTKIHGEHWLDAEEIGNLIDLTETDGCLICGGLVFEKCSDRTTMTISDSEDYPTWKVELASGHIRSLREALKSCCLKYYNNGKEGTWLS